VVIMYSIDLFGDMGKKNVSIGRNGIIVYEVCQRCRGVEVKSKE
jgi:hypothetical protein